MKKTIKKDFPELYQFFAGYFADAATDNISDMEVVLNYKNDCLNSKNGTDYLKNTYLELQKLISEIPDYWEDVEDTANRYFENVQQALVWLNMIKRELD